jgi:hypothetical protein
MAELLSLSGESVGTVEAPDDVQAIAWAMRLYIRQPDGTYREQLPFVAREPWPASLSLTPPGLPPNG